MFDNTVFAKLQKDFDDGQVGALSLWWIDEVLVTPAGANMAQFDGYDITSIRDNYVARDGLHQHQMYHHDFLFRKDLCIFAASP